MKIVHFTRVPACRRVCLPRYHILYKSSKSTSNCCSKNRHRIDVIFFSCFKRKYSWRRNLIKTCCPSDLFCNVLNEIKFVIFANDITVKSLVEDNQILSFYYESISVTPKYSTMLLGMP